MKNTNFYRLFAMLIVWISVSVSAQTYTRPCTDKKLVRKAQKWIKKGEWRNGFTAAKPHKTVNAVEFYNQYHKNPEQWNAMFRWLAQHDLQAISGGSHPIEGTKLKVSVEDSENEDLSRRGSESHRTHIDFQYVVRGAERFGLIEHETSKPNCAYTPDVLHYDYDRANARFYDSTPAEFFLFFPDDWHIAKVKTDQPDQHIRVLVVKVDYVE